jgi:adenylate cyclase
VRRLRSFLVLSAVTVVVGFAISVILDFALTEARGATVEDTLALPLLFKIRGPLPSPPEVVIVSMDATSTAVLNLPTKTRDWPRSLHARLIQRLAKQGASAIAVDLEFARQTEPAEDEALARAIEEAGNVVLVEWIDRFTGPGFKGEERRPPIPSFLAFAGALAPAPVPAGALVTQTWSFLPGPDRDETPTLPSATLHVYSRRLLEEFHEILRNTGLHVPGPVAGPRVAWQDLRQTMRLIRLEVKKNASASAHALKAVDTRVQANLGPEDAQTLKALIRLYRDPGVFYLSYYGPPGTIRTIPYHNALDEAAPALDFSGKVVFIGAGFSAIWNVDHGDTHHAAYGSRDGQEFSGVEIHATAFANLLRGEMLRPLGWVATLICSVGFAMAATGIAYFLPRGKSGVAALLLVVAYYEGTQLLFNFGHVLVPLAVPVLVQVPIAFVAIHFARKPIWKKVVNGTCLVADIVDSTALAKSLGPARQGELLDGYWLEVGGAARSWSGTVQTPQVGDSLVCFWTASPSEALPEPGESGPKRSGCNVDRLTRHRSCMAALEITRAVARFNAAHSDEHVLTRLGLHVGQFSVGRDLDGERCTVVGHTVSVATRFEELGKVFLGDTEHARLLILASSDVVEGLDDLLTRYLGHHELKGVGRLAVYQLVGEKRRLGQTEFDLCERFAVALRLYEDERWQEARLAFNEILAFFRTDGPSRYFAGECASRLAR